MTTLINTVFIHNPLEQFEIKEFFYMGGPLLGAKFSLTNIGLYLIIVTTILLRLNYSIKIYVSYLARALSLRLRLTANMTDILILILVFQIFFTFNSYIDRQQKPLRGLPMDPYRNR
jgi:hypothetical protein